MQRYATICRRNRPRKKRRIVASVENLHFLFHLHGIESIERKVKNTTIETVKSIATSRTRLFVPVERRRGLRSTGPSSVSYLCFNTNVNNNCQITSNERQISFQGTKLLRAATAQVFYKEAASVSFRPVLTNSN